MLAARGSQKWLQLLINHRPEILDRLLRERLRLQADERIEWRSPLARDGYTEYQDERFLNVLGVELSECSLTDFWPTRGPVWDGLGRTTAGRLLLVEAKAHIPEMLSTMKARSPGSVHLIEQSLAQVKTALGVRRPVDWTSSFYQYTNRIAHLYLLRELNHLPAELLFVCFVGDDEMRGPRSAQVWEGAIELLEGYLALPRRHRLSEHIHHVFVDVDDLAT